MFSVFSYFLWRIFSLAVQRILFQGKSDSIYFSNFSHKLIVFVIIFQLVIKWSLSIRKEEKPGGVICKPNSWTLSLRACTTRAGKRTGEQAAQLATKSWKFACHIPPTIIYIYIYISRYSYPCIYTKKYAYIYIPGLLVNWKSVVPALRGRKTPVPHDFWPESRNTACIPGPPVPPPPPHCLDLWWGGGFELDFDCK